MGVMVDRMMHRATRMVRRTVGMMMMDLCKRNSGHTEERETKQQHFVHIVSFKVYAI
jgi:hypothetical protein